MRVSGYKNNFRNSYCQINILNKRILTYPEHVPNLYPCAVKPVVPHMPQILIMSHLDFEELMGYTRSSWGLGWRSG